MNKFILILLYALVLSFSFQYFFPPKLPIDTTASNILLSVADDTIVVPNIPKLT